jgi:hypothetical protein
MNSSYIQKLRMDWAPAFAPNGVSIDRVTGFLSYRRARSTKCTSSAALRALSFSMMCAR